MKKRTITIPALRASSIPSARSFPSARSELKPVTTSPNTGDHFTFFVSRPRVAEALAEAQALAKVR